MAELFGGNRRVWVEHGCQAGSSFWFKGDPPFPSSTAHMFFVLGKLGKGAFLIVNATSQVDSGERHLANRVKQFGVRAEDVSVRLSPGEYTFIKKDTVIDCSRPHLVTVDSLVNGKEFALMDLADNDLLFKRLLMAYVRSPFVEPAHLNAVRKQWQNKGLSF